MRDGEQHKREEAMMCWKATLPGLVVISLVNADNETDRQIFSESLSYRSVHALFYAEVWEAEKHCSVLIEDPEDQQL